MRLLSLFLYLSGTDGSAGVGEAPSSMSVRARRLGMAGQRIFWVGGKGWSDIKRYLCGYERRQDT